MPHKFRIYCITEGINVYITADTAPTTCPNNSAHTVNSNSVSIVDNYPVGGHLFGDGSDLDVVISTNTTLSRDMYYRNLTITSGAILSTNGYRIFVSDTTNITNGYISAAGSSGSGQTAGAVPYTAKVLGTGSVGGAGGAASSSGSNAGTFSSLTAMGGAGGAGGTAGYAGGAGGSASPPSNSTGGPIVFKIANHAITGRDLGGSLMNGGTGGGGGGGNSLGAGGGGGSGGGMVILSSRFISYVGSYGILANGGNGSAPTVSASGGGGGGGGGCVVVISSSDISGITINVSGGTGGLSGGTGGNGNNGVNGQIFRITI